MDIKEIIQIFGLPEDASEEDVRTALKADTVYDADEKSLVVSFKDKSVAGAQD